MDWIPVAPHEEVLGFGMAEERLEEPVEVVGLHLSVPAVAEHIELGDLEAGTVLGVLIDRVIISS